MILVVSRVTNKNLNYFHVRMDINRDLFGVHEIWTIPVYNINVHDIIFKLVLSQQGALSFYQGKSLACPALQCRKQKQFDKQQTAVVQLKNVLVLLFTLFKVSNDLMSCTDCLISFLSLSEMHQVALLSLELFNSTFADFCNRTENT